MIYEARRNGWPVVDATHSIKIVHQDHDYSHLPGGQPHYRHPETRENVRLGGGDRTIFTLMDCSHELVDGKLHRERLSWEKLWREVEIFPIVRLHSKSLAQVFYALFHPVRAYREFRSWLRLRSEHGKGMNE
jgi:predicted acetyltransferase